MASSQPARLQPTTTGRGLQGAVEADLASDFERLLHRQRLIVNQLQRTLVDLGHDTLGLRVTLVHGRSDIQTHLQKLWDQCQREILVIDREYHAPLVANADRNDSIDPAVRRRYVISPGSCAESGPTLNPARAGALDKVEVRTARRGLVPLMLVDRSVVLVGADGSFDQTAMRVEEPALVQVVIQLTERVWASATPLGQIEPRAVQLTERQLRVLDRLCAGLTDQAIARHLRVSERTVRSEVAVILARLGADSRCEAGFLAGQLDLLAGLGSRR